ncbi:permease [Kribbella catacumbae]|uniref:permease n=1 Tax=Kribbella catacumbae TaxID=460086 RepID=UPI00192BA378|nr:permease [Kribbella catacumbae]
MVGSVLDLLGRVLGDVWSTFTHVWPFLVASIVIASALVVYIGTDRLAVWLRKSTPIAVVGAVALGAATPFCSCGTTAVVLGALASHVPWAPVVAFMVSSPLTSPEELVLSTGLFGAPFALTFFIAAIVLGLVAGLATFAIERTGWLEGQARMTTPAGAATSCTPAPSGQADATTAYCDSGTGTSQGPVTVLAPVGSRAGLVARLKFRELAREILTTGRRLALFFFGFATLGYLLIEAVPTRWLTDYLGGDSFLAVPLAALLGIPVYLNTDGSLPLVATLMDGGMGTGPALAFLVTGAGTSVGAISGMLLIARRRVVALVVGSLYLGAVVLGWLAPLWL